MSSMTHLSPADGLGRVYVFSLLHFGLRKPEKDPAANVPSNIQPSPSSPWSNVSSRLELKTPRCGVPPSPRPEGLILTPTPTPPPHRGTTYPGQQQQQEGHWGQPGGHLGSDVSCVLRSQLASEPGAEPRSSGGPPHPRARPHSILGLDPSLVCSLPPPPSGATFSLAPPSVLFSPNRFPFPAPAGPSLPSGPGLCPSVQSSWSA